MGSLRLTRGGAVLATIPVARADAGIVVAPGGNLNTAYSQCPEGGTIWLQTGRYGIWQTPTGSKRITVAALPGHTPKFKQLSNRAANITYDGIDVDAEGAKPNGSAFADGGADHVTFKNGRIGNVVDEKGALVDGTGMTFDNVYFHDVVLSSAGEAADVHMEGLFSMSPNITIRNCRFENCAIFNVFFTRGSWWSPPQPGYGGFTITNNFFGRTRRANGQGTHFYTVSFGDTSATWKPGTRGEIRDLVARNNVSELPWNDGENNCVRCVESCNSPRTGLPGIVVEPCV